MSIYDKFLYFNAPLTITKADIEQYSLAFEQKVFEHWELKARRNAVVNTLFCGLGWLFQERLTSKKELENRLECLRNKALKVDRAIRVVQRARVNKLYEQHRKTSACMHPYASFTVGSRLSQFGQLAKVWWDNKSIDMMSGMKGQIIWPKAVALGAELKKAGYYVFYHAHSYPITLHLELTSFFQTVHQSDRCKTLKPLESRRKFRAPGVGQFYKNTTEYLQSSLGKMINSGAAMDDHYRETILSCDAIEDNDQPFESCKHFFKSNQSIVDTKSSTGQTSAFFDRSFIQNHLNNDCFQEYAVTLFAQARQKLKELPGYGMIRVIAIVKKTIENPKTNYVWRSHAFGRLCTCCHTRGKIGHREFVATLQKHQGGVKTRCTTFASPYPQYRILVKNLDKDPNKQIYTMDCLETKERKIYNELFENLRIALLRMYRLENISTAKSYEELLQALLGIDLKVQSLEYKRGIKREILKHKAIILAYMQRLEQDLPAESAILIRAACNA